MGTLGPHQDIIATSELPTKGLWDTLLTSFFLWERSTW